ncbi:MAG: hypothetical protein IPK76_15000 [Lewinellaceae bacterium]|jgi:hypothetical protein|nr:hypothetical protein [Lewinellaceae bacterium]
MAEPIPIYNFYHTIRQEPMRYRQFAFDELLIAEFSCPLESDLQAMWSHHNGRRRTHRCCP